MQAVPITPPYPHNRIVIIGPSGAGKTTLATALADRLNLHHVELDALHWEPNWVEAPNEVMLARVDDALPADGRWVTDGNYAAMRGVVWARGQTLVWLDYSLGLTLWRLLRRSIARIFWRTELWNGNREDPWHLLSLDPDTNLFLHNVQVHGRQRARFEEALGRPEYAHLRVMRFRSSRETEEWVAGLPVEEPSKDL